MGMAMSRLTLTRSHILPCTSQQKLDTKNKIFFRFNPKFVQLRIVHDTVVVLSTLRNKLAALH